MKVKDLIAELQKYDQEMLVVVNGYEGGFDSISKVKTIKVTLNARGVEEYWYGEHADARFDTDETGTEVVYLPRKS